MNAKELRELTINKNKPKQDKYMIKLRKKIDKRAKRGYNKYVIPIYYTPKWFDFKFKMRIERELKIDGFIVLVGVGNILIEW